MMEAGAPQAAAQQARAEEATRADDASLARELLVAGVPLARVAELFRGRVDEGTLNGIVREAVTQSPNANLSLLVLQRSKSSVQDAQFVSAHMRSLTSDAPEELLDPLFCTLMRDPVVISTGYVFDRCTVLDEQGHLKFRSCPFTRAHLKPDVYPLVEKRRKLQEFKERRLDTMVTTASAFLEDRNFAQFGEVVSTAEQFLDDLGENTYIHHARRLAELNLAAAEMPGRAEAVRPQEWVRIYSRIHRTLQGDEVAEFERKVARLEREAERALAEGRVEDASAWCDACEAAQSSGVARLPVGRLRLRLAKEQGADLRLPRRLAYREICGDPGAVERFFREEGVGPADVREARVLLLRRSAVDDSAADDDWHLALQSHPLEGPVQSIEVAAREFADQGWGNYKGNLILELVDGGGAQVAWCNLFGTYRSEGYAYGRSPSRTLGIGEEVVARAQAGFRYCMKYTVGGGGGHRITVRDWSCRIFPEGWTGEDATVDWFDWSAETPPMPNTDSDSDYTGSEMTPD